MSKEKELTSVEKWVMKYMNYSLKDIKLNRKLLKEDMLFVEPKQTSQASLKRS